GKAARGVKAADILAFYYAGLKPVAVPAKVLPRTINVSVATGPTVTVNGPGRFRVLDGAGKTLAAVASGDWQVTTATDGKVRVIPPVDQRGPLAVTPAAAEPASLAVAAPATVPVDVHFRLSVPALVRVTVQAPGGQPVTLPEQPYDAGELRTSVAVPAAATGGPPIGNWKATITADAGPGRPATVPG